MLSVVRDMKVFFFKMESLVLDTATFGSKFLEIRANASSLKKFKAHTGKTSGLPYKSPPRL